MAFRDRLLLSLFTIFGCQSYMYGQENPINPESLFNYEAVGTPATAALVKNIVYPVDYSTGLPEIKIPLYEVKSGSITLPIYLSYHASGIKLSDVDGWTGVGWSLVAEPIISRTIQGAEDNPVTRFCDFDTTTPKDYLYLYTMANDKCREQPDEYYYRLLGKQGMFMYSMHPQDSTRHFLPLPYEDIRIDWTGRFFKIIDDDGTTYTFDGGQEYGGMDKKTVGWKASSIISANRMDGISFVYDNEWIKYSVKTHDDCVVVRDAFEKKFSIASMRNDFPAASAFLPDEWMQDPVIYSTVMNVTKTYQRNEEGKIVPDYYGSYPTPSDHYTLSGSQSLQEIHFSQGKVVFTQKARKLEKITIYNLSGQVVREIQFNYMVSGTVLTPRYYLESIVVTDIEKKQPEDYHFDYYAPERLPAQGSRSIDIWGYFNGSYTSSNPTLVPRQTIITTTKRQSPNNPAFIENGDNVSLSFGSYLREADERFMICGTLKEITYPTGSTDEFIYEAHRYRRNTDEAEIRIVGGLRIKQIKTKTKNKEIKVRTFKYGKDEDGNGMPIINDHFNYFMLNQPYYLGDPLRGNCIYATCYYGPDVDQYIVARQRIFFCHPIWPVTYDGGSFVMYDYVTEYNGTPEVNSGKTVYQYYLQAPLSPPDPHNTIQGNQHDGWKSGHLISKTVYKNNNGEYEPLESIENEYSSLKKYFGDIIVGEVGMNVAVKKAGSGYVPESVKSNVSYQPTTIKVGAKLLLKREHKTYADGGAVSAVTEYEYADSTSVYPTRITETGSDSVNYVTVLAYPKDYKNVYPYTDMIERNILSSVVKKEYIRGGSYIGIETPFIKSSRNIYKPGSLVVRRDSLGDGDIRATYLYDDYGKIRQETRDGKESIVYLYGYKNENVIARIENATYAHVVAALGSENIINTLALGSGLSSYDIQIVNSLRDSLPASRVTTYTYKPLVGVSSITDPFGLTTNYEYDRLGRLTEKSIMNKNKKELVESYKYNYTNQ